MCRMKVLLNIVCYWNESFSVTSLEIGPSKLTYDQRSKVECFHVCLPLCHRCLCGSFISVHTSTGSAHITRTSHLHSTHRIYTACHTWSTWTLHAEYYPWLYYFRKSWCACETWNRSCLRVSAFTRPFARFVLISNNSEKKCALS